MFGFDYSHSMLHDTVCPSMTGENATLDLPGAMVEDEKAVNNSANVL